MRDGYKLEGTDFLLLAFGAYGDVFASESLGLVRKVFRREQNESDARKTFEYERRAHQRALSDDRVSRLVPGQFQQLPEVRVVDSMGVDRTYLYYPDLAFEMAWVRAPFAKIGNLRADERALVEPFISELRAIGIGYTSDASVAWNTPTHPTFIDFATEEFEVRWRD